MNLGKRIYELRKKNSLSQEQLAEQIGVARQTISKWELGETAPDIKQAQALCRIFNVSLDEFVGNASEEDKDAHHNEYLTTTQLYRRKALPWKKIIVIVISVICSLLAIFMILNIFYRTYIIRPQYTEIISKTIVINRKGQAQLRKIDTGAIVFNADGKPAIACSLPERFAPSEEIDGLYIDDSGNYIKFNSDYAANIINPLMGTKYYSYYTSHGANSYLDMLRLAMYSDVPESLMLASDEELHLAGGAQIIRDYLCADRDADYYELGGELASNGKILIYGFALNFNDKTWLVTLKDYEDNYYFITVKDSIGIGSSIEALVDFLSSIYAGNALRYFEAKNSAAMQAATAAYKEYYAIDLADDGKVDYEYFVYKTSDGRFVSIHNTVIGVYNRLDDALSSMMTDHDGDRLHETCVENLFAYDASN